MTTLVIGTLILVATAFVAVGLEIWFWLRDRRRGVK